MSNALPPRPTSCDTPWSIGVVTSLYNPTWGHGLRSHFEEELLAICPNSNLLHHEVPGAFELPLAVDLLAQFGKVEAIAAFGVLLDGETAHATLVAQAVTESLLRSALQYRIPVLHEVLLVKNTQQAELRCLSSDLNRGTEAARAAVRILRSVRSIRALHPNHSLHPSHE